MSINVSFGIHNIFSLASRERCMTNLKKIGIPKFRKLPTATAAVLVPLCNVQDVPSILYTVRSSNLRTNSGEISFPGGKTDLDETPVQTALRETNRKFSFWKWLLYFGSTIFPLSMDYGRNRIE
ncbi:Nucleoside diphosphate-linked moiety X motif 8 [Operophtera brumata]|uniref:Nucleoside diphosphate-linked moiety X motif 8 n=1 Tax=Operophtera brumata TaxID=104452 RepID=A0A0L7KNS9_OPEBR|nr:Nucleoside diphosphate-linked moiety X motif 8 [Operophtera brumata]